MLTSINKYEETKLYEDMLEILSIAIRSYERTGDEKLLEHITRINELTEQLKVRLATHDFIEEDARTSLVLKALHDKNRT